MITVAVEAAKQAGDLAYRYFKTQPKIKYKPDAKGRLRIMSKDEMRSMGVESPDVADAAMLSFVRPEHGDLTKRREDRLKKRKKQHRGRGLRLTMGGH